KRARTARAPCPTWGSRPEVCSWRRRWSCGSRRPRTPTRPPPPSTSRLPSARRAAGWRSGEPSDVGHLVRASALALGLGAAACAQIVGVSEVPLPPDASLEDAAPEANAEAATADDAPLPGEEPDVAVQTEAGNDGATPMLDAGRDVAPEAAAPDTSTCPPWDRYDLTRCGPCGQEQCCGPLSACEAADDAGLD